MSDELGPDAETRADGVEAVELTPSALTASMLGRAVQHVDQLLDTLDRTGEPASNATSRAQTAWSAQASDLPIAGQAPRPFGLDEVVQFSVSARAAADRVRAEADRVRAEAALQGVRLLSDAIKTAAQAQAEAEHEWGAKQRWAAAYTRAADDALLRATRSPDLPPHPTTASPRSRRGSGRSNPTSRA